jgi:2,4-dienoyl-CoA reductase-like NADH-dependent reductase (Old Yellow Enzyme family)
MYLARLVKKVVPVPVIGVGRINDMQQAEYHLQREDCDIVYMGRQLFADSEAPRKYFEGRAEETVTEDEVAPSTELQELSVA